MASAGRSYTPEQAAIAQRVCALDQGSYYEILEVDEHTNDAEIKRSFKLLALQLHPDKNGAPGAEEAFKLVAEAYEVLSNPQERASYDNERRGGFSTFYTGSYGSYANNDDFEYEDPPPYRPRTPAPNETRKQRRQREYEDRKARQREKDQAERKARRKEKERRRAAKFRSGDDMLRFFADMGVRFVFCEQCDCIHMQLDGEPVEHDPPPHRPQRASMSSQRSAARPPSPVRPRASQQAAFEEVPAELLPEPQEPAPRPATNDLPAGSGRLPTEQPPFSGNDAAEIHTPPAFAGAESTSPKGRPSTALEQHMATAVIVAGLALAAFVVYKVIRLALRATWGRIAFGACAVIFLVLCCPPMRLETPEREQTEKTT
ncbi:DnaJ-domain-containing protein [Auricularia subglabra TFB-10046 SS5]|nr:DnaJ-domain-containing protein [Auricularia subglabra TFB-10046 SS5]